MKQQRSEEEEVRLVRAQWGQMMWWASQGWRPAAAGHRCPDCDVRYWSVQRGRVESFRCPKCGCGRSVQTR